VKECFGIELAGRFFAGAFGVTSEDPEIRRQQREECYGCPDFEHCYMALSLVYNLRMAEEAKRTGARPTGRLT
jgi:hypothetical protein